jgi:hypothetical protein
VTAPFDLDGWLKQWRGWLAPVTDRLFDLDERTRDGAPSEQADVAAAFVARKAIADRVDAVAAAMTRDRAAATALAGAPVVDDTGGPVGTDLDDAARLVDAVLAKVEREVGGREISEARDLQLRAGLATDLATAERLSVELGERVNQVADLRRAADAGRSLADTAAAAAKVRTDLEQRSSERLRLLERWRSIGAEIDALAVEEGEVRELAARCREKVLAPPPIAVPSTQVVAARYAEAGDVDGRPWPAARPTVTALVGQVDQLRRALSEARRRFSEPLTRRDDLRGLLQSFRRKAAAKGFGEHPDIDSRYRAAEAVLWSAPCDLAAAGRQVDEFVAVVNAMTGAPR